jgi:hypothetical protein
MITGWLIALGLLGLASYFDGERRQIERDRALKWSIMERSYQWRALFQERELALRTFYGLAKEAHLIHEQGHITDDEFNARLLALHVEYEARVATLRADMDALTGGHK